MIRDVKLLNFLPQYVQEYKEIKNIMTAENPEFQMVEDESEIIKDNQFIMTCNEVGISMFERLLGITPSYDDTLEDRRNRVITRWNDGIPYTIRILVERLMNLCGEGNFTVELQHNDYKLIVMTRVVSKGQIEDVRYLLNTLIPCNLVSILVNLVCYEIDACVFTGVPLVSYGYRQIPCEYHNQYEIGATVTSGNPLTVTKHYIISQEEN